MADFTNLDNEQDNLLAFLNLVKDVVGDAPAAHAAIVSLTDNSGGTGTDTLEACGAVVTGVDGTANNAASKADVDTRLASIANNVADLSDKLEEVLGALRTIGLLTA